MVENPTDEDWAGVKMALISGRPISFKMDLYNPLFINRPDGGAGTVRVAAAGHLSRQLRTRTRHGVAWRRLRHARTGRRRHQRSRRRVGPLIGGAGARPRWRRHRRAGWPDGLPPQSADRMKRPGRQRTTRRALAGETGRELGDRLATGHGRQRGHGRGARRLLPVHHRPPGLTGTAEERHAPHRRQGHRGAEGLASTTRASRPSTRCSASSSRTRSGRTSTRDRSPSSRGASTPATPASSTSSPTRNGSSATPSTSAPRSMPRSGPARRRSPR